MASTPRHWATMSSILIWKISWLIVSPKGTCRKSVPSEVGVECCEEWSFFCQVHPKECFVVVYFGKFCGSCENMGYLLKVLCVSHGWWLCLYPLGQGKFSTCHLPSWGMWESWPLGWAQSVWWWFLDEPSLPLFLDLLVLDGNFPSSVLNWRDCRVCLDVILPWYVSDAVKTVGKHCLKIPGTINGCRTWLHLDGVESRSFGWWMTWGLIFHWLCCLCCLRISMTWLTSWTGTIHFGLSLLTLFARVLKEVNFWDPSSGGLERTCYFWFFFCHFWQMVLKELSDCALSAVVLKGVDEWSWKGSDLLLCFIHGSLPSTFKQGSWKEFLELVFALFSMAKTNLETFLHKTQMSPSLMLAGCPTMISFGILVSTTKK